MCHMKYPLRPLAGKSMKYMKVALLGDVMTLGSDDRGFQPLRGASGLLLETSKNRAPLGVISHVF